LSSGAVSGAARGRCALGIAVAWLAPAGCGRGLYGDAHALAPDDAHALGPDPGDRSEGGAAPAPDGDAPDEASDGAGIDVAAIDGGNRGAASDGAPAGPAPLPASTVWRPCGKVGEHWPMVLAHAPDGKQLLVGYDVTKLELLPVGGGAPLGDDTVEGTPSRLAFSANGAFYAVAGQNGLDVHTAPHVSGGGNRAGVKTPRALRFSPADDHLVLVTGDPIPGTANIQLWRNVDTGLASELRLERELEGGAETAFAPDGASLRTVVDGRTLITELLDGQVQGRVPLATPLQLATFSPDGTLLAGITPEGALALDRAADGHRQWTTATVERPERLLFLGGSPRLLLLYGDHAEMRTLGDGKPLLPIHFGQRLLAVDPAPDGTSLAGIGETGAVVRLAVADGHALPAPTPMVDAPLPETPSLAVSRDGQRLAGYQPVLWDLSTGVVTSVVWSTGMQLDFSPGGDQLAISNSGSAGCTVVRIGDRGQLSVSSDLCASGLVFSADGSRLAAAHDFDIAVLDASAHLERPLVSRVKHPGLAFSPDGTALASSGHEVWNIADGSSRWMQPPDPFTAGVAAPDTDNSVAFSPDGSRLLISTSERMPGGTQWTTHTRLHDARTGDPIQDFQGRLGRRPSFSPDGTWIAAGPQVLHLASGTTRTLDAAAVIARFLPDGRIAAGTPDGVVTIYCPSTP
jgi:hypothetical protein